MLTNLTPDKNFVLASTTSSLFRFVIIIIITITITIIIIIIIFYL